MTENRNTIAQRLMKGFAAHSFLQFVQLFIRLAEVPILIAAWGLTGYGHWLMIAAIPTALSISDGGFTKAAQREMTMRAGRSDRVGILEVFQSTFVLLTLLSVAVTSILFAPVSHVSIGELLNIEATGSDGINTSVLILALKVLVAFQCGLLYGVFSCGKAYGKGTFLLAVSQLLEFFGLIFGILIYGTFVSAASGSLIGRTLGYIIMLAAARSFDPSIRYGLRYTNRLVIKKLLAPSFANLAFPMGEVLNLQGLRLLIGTTVSPAALVIFSSTRTLCRLALQGTMSIARTIEPEISIAYGESNYKRMRQLLVYGTQSTLWLSILLCSVLLLIGEPLFSVWTNGKAQFDWKITLLLLGASLINSIWCVAISIPSATNRNIKLALYYVLIYGMFCILLAALLIKAWGVAGAAVSLLAAELVMGLVVIYIASKLLGSPITTWLPHAVRPPVKEVRALLKNKCKTWGVN